MADIVDFILSQQGQRQLGGSGQALQNLRLQASAGNRKPSTAEVLSALGRGLSAGNVAFTQEEQQAADNAKAAELQALQLAAAQRSEAEAARIAGAAEGVRAGGSGLNEVEQQIVDVTPSNKLGDVLAAIAENRAEFELKGTESKVVQSSKILPGGVTQITFKDGTVVAKELPEDEVALVKAAEERGTSIAAQRAEGRAAGAVTGKGESGRVQDTIQLGIDAVQGIPILRRSLQLLERIETGGIDAARLRAKQLFGVEGADEGELSANLGRAVLSRLRETFGAAFTEREGARLERMSAGFGKSAATNKRLLRQALKIADDAAQRAIEASRKSGDTEAESQLLDFVDGRFDLTDEALASAFTPRDEQQAAPAPSGIQEGATATNPTTGETIVFRDGQWQTQ